MKILLVILHDDPARGGAERYTRDLASALPRLGHDVALASSDTAGAPRGYKSVHLEAAGLTRTRRYLQFLKSLESHLAAVEYDIIHAMLPVPRCDVYHPHAGVARDAARGWNVHFNPRRKAMARVEHDLLRGPTPPTVLCLSEYVKASILQHYPGLDHRLTTLFNAVDLDRFQPTSRTPHPLVHALIIAQDFQRKGLRQTIEALARVNDRRLHLTVVGKEAAGEYLRLAESLGVGQQVQFTGPAPDPRPFYRAADFFILPTKHDPCSLVVLEALAMGLPVISTRFNGACEVMTDGKHGFVLPDPSEVAALAGAMRKLMDEQTKMRMSEACLELRPKLSYDNHLRALVNIYEQVVSEKCRK
jgi:UDP-glucose:(heptosyl)LPS alpha-1,3-glucosyltransferase